MKDSYPPYKAGWVHEDICRRLEKFSRDVAAGLSPRLMLFLPPRHGKSFLASERFPVWHLGHYPHHQILMTSYGQALSDKFSKRARTLAQSDLVKRVFGLELDPERQAVQEWETTKGGAYRSVGIGGSATGTGCDILIIDDPIKNAEEANSKAKRDSDWEWYQTTAYTRLMPGAGVLVVQTRWHEDDLSGRLLKAMKDGDGDEWEVACYPAIAEQDEQYRKKGEVLHAERYDEAKLARIRRAIGPRAWNALYQQRPSAVEGTTFKRSWWKYYRETPNRFERVVASWDCNFKGGPTSDYVVGTIWGKIGADYYLLDRVRGQWDFVETIAEVRKLVEKWPQARPILIEDAANGPAVISSLKGKIGGIIGIQPNGSKEARATVVTPLAEGGNLYLPEGAPWLDEWIEEYAAFPRGANDDQVDSGSQAIIYLEEEGKHAVFDNITAAFGNAADYPMEDWVSRPEGPRETLVGAKWGSGGHPHVFYALGKDGETLGYEQCSVTNHNEALDALRSFVRRVSGASHSTVFFDASGVGRTMSELISLDTSMDWRVEGIDLTPVQCDASVAKLRASLAGAKLKLRPWSVLFEQMAAFRMQETEKGTMVYGPPEGLSANAVFALMLAHEAWLKYANGEAVVAVVGQIEREIARLYYGSGHIDDLD